MEKQINGWFAYRGVTLMQHENVAIPFHLLLQQVKPKRVLEIGTSHGALTLLTRDLLDELELYETQIKSYDVFSISQEYVANMPVKGKSIEFIIKNIFNDTYDSLKDNEIVDYIQSPGTTLVLCDGGSKKNEFKIISPYLKRGDIIMAHDYAPNQDYFENNIKDKIWNWWEIQDSDIESAVVENNLKPYMEKEFREVVWVCKIKN